MKQKRTLNTFGGKLSFQLWKRDISMTQFASQLGMGNATIFHYCGDERVPTVDTFMYMAETLDLSDEEILDMVNSFRRKK